MITAVHAQFPDFGMRRTSGVDQHNDQLRFGWDLLAADGSTILTGIDAGELAPDGRLSASPASGASCRRCDGQGGGTSSWPSG